MSLVILAISHKEVCVEEVGNFHISPDEQKTRLKQVKDLFQIGELMFLSTCNRVEWTLADLPENFNTDAFLARVYPNVSIDLLKQFVSYKGEEAVQHAMKVASSLESMVVGEREIITQFRKSYEFAEEEKLAGEQLRLFSKEVVLAAKRIFSETDIATKPVSVVSLAFKEFQEARLPENANVLVVGAGQTNTNFLRFLKKHFPKFNYHIFNRTVESGEELAALVAGEAFPLAELENYDQRIDLLVACTGAEAPIIDASMYAKWASNGATFPRVIVDLGLPADVDPEVADDSGAYLISMARLQPISQANLASRHKAIRHCNKIIEEALGHWRNSLQGRKLELALSSIPLEMRKFRKRAEEEIFASDLEKMDAASKETLQRILDYLEKKYVGIPYKITKQVMLPEGK